MAHRRPASREVSLRAMVRGLVLETGLALASAVAG